MVAAYMEVNDNTVWTAAPAPRVERAFRMSCGCRFHTAVDLVWGYFQFLLSLRGQEVLACVSRSGITYPIRGVFGPNVALLRCRRRRRCAHVESGRSSPVLLPMRLLLPA